LRVKKRNVGEKELDAIVAERGAAGSADLYAGKLCDQQRNVITANAQIKLLKQEDALRLCGWRTWPAPIDAAFLAIEQIIGHHL
jgi:hypothetical protein